MTTVQNLLAYEDIRRLKFQYMRALDTHDWALMESLYIEDAVVWFGDGKYSCQGRDNIMRLYRRLLTDDFISSHIAVHPEIDLTSETTAKAKWRFEDTVHFLAANPAVQKVHIKGGEELQGAGYYSDEYVRVDATWKIKSSGYVRIYERVESRGTREIELIVDSRLGIKDRA